MNLVNKVVTHESFGKGNVIKCSDSYIKIHFQTGDKRFVFPDAFKKYLTLMDQKAANSVKVKIQKKEKERQEKALKLKEEKALQAKRQSLLKRRESIKQLKAHPRLQSAFRCKDEEVEELFTEWHVFTGVIKSGQKKGQPRKLARINYNSGCLLTVRDNDELEEDRRILGIFMVDENFDGGLCNDGYIPAHPEYRIQLSEDESKKMLFWNYYINKRYPNKMVWNSGRQRYFDNIWMGQILRDIVSIKKNPQEQEYAQRFFKYFCQINGIEKKELPKPNGALMRIK